MNDYTAILRKIEIGINARALAARAETQRLGDELRERLKGEFAFLNRSIGQQRRQRRARG